MSSQAIRRQLKQLVTRAKSFSLEGSPSAALSVGLKAQQRSSIFTDSKTKTIARGVAAGSLNQFRSCARFKRVRCIKCPKSKIACARAFVRSFCSISSFVLFDFVVRFVRFLFDHLMCLGRERKKRALEERSFR